MWWNFDSQINPNELPLFTPLPNQRFTHEPEINKYGVLSNDVIVNIPKAGLGTFIGFSSHVNYDYTWSQWPPLKGRIVNIFLGIPYAAPPIGDQRFRLPVPAYLDTRYPWYAKRFRSACMQPSLWLNIYIPGFKDINEDCLYLNIYTPNETWVTPETLYPVIVHVHGGSFVYGSSHLYPALALASKGAVVVTFNYRLGPFGFLSTGDLSSIGNFGLWDQIMVLDWVKQHIIWFRGDPERITLMGESAGAASVGLHLISPKTRERYLFNQAIMMSGSELSHWAVTDPEKVRTRYYAIELGIRLGCKSVQTESVRRFQTEMRKSYWRPTNITNTSDNSTIPRRFVMPYSVQIDAYALINCLRYEKSADEINKIVSKLEVLPGAPHFIWTPVVDGTAGFLPRMPIEERQLDQFSKIPLIAGVVHDEGSRVLKHFLSRTNHELYMVKNFSDKAARYYIDSLLKRRNVFRQNETATELYTRYTWWPDSTNNTARWERIVALVSDMEIIAPLNAVVKYHSKHQAPVYFYEFAYAGKHDTQSTPETGIYHGIELPFLFGFPFMNVSIWKSLFNYPKTSVLPSCTLANYSYPHDTNMSEFIMDLWINFVKFGNPTPTSVKNVTWLRFQQSEEAYLHIYINSSTRYKLRPSDMAFWQHRFDELADVIAASPPLYYIPLIKFRLSTVILSVVLFLLVIVLIVIVILIKKYDNKNKFESQAKTGTTPGFAFQNAFNDSFVHCRSSIDQAPYMSTTSLKPMPLYSTGSYATCNEPSKSEYVRPNCTKYRRSSKQLKPANKRIYDIPDEYITLNEPCSNQFVTDV